MIECLPYIGECLAVNFARIDIVLELEDAVDICMYVCS